MGVPLVCIPLLADQLGNAALVAARGAGIRLDGGASPTRIAHALGRVLTEPAFRGAAGRLALYIAKEDGAQNAAAELEVLAPR